MQSPLPFIFLALSSAAQGNYSPRTDLEEGRYLKALAEAETQIKLSPTNALAWAAKAHSLSALLRFGEALEAANRSLSLNPNLADGYLARGLARGGNAIQQRNFGSLKKAVGALGDLKRATELDPTLSLAWMSLGLAYQEMPGILGGSTRKALQCAEAFRKVNPILGDSLRGLILSLDGKWHEGELCFQRALAAGGASDPKVVIGYLEALGNPETRETLGQANQQRMLVKEGRRLLPGMRGHAKGVEAVSEALLAGGQPDEAWDVTLEALEKVQSPSILRLHLGKIAARSGIHRNEALVYLNQVLGEPIEGDCGGQAAAFWRKAQILKDLGRLKEAREAAEAGLKVDPKHPGASKLLKEIRI